MFLFVFQIPILLFLIYTSQLIIAHNFLLGFTVSSANFFFHGLFPDHIETNEGKRQKVCKVLFDVDFEGEFHSHLLADLYPLEEQQWRASGIPEYDVRYNLPFHCKEFSKTVVQYYQLVMGPQASTISHSGPKGPIPNHNVCRVQWQVSLPANKK